MFVKWANRAAEAPGSELLSSVAIVDRSSDPKPQPDPTAEALAATWPGPEEPGAELLSSAATIGRSSEPKQQPDPMAEALTPAEEPPAEEPGSELCRLCRGKNRGQTFCRLWQP